MHAATITERAVTPAGEPLALAHRAELEPLLAARWLPGEPPERTLSDPWFANLYLFRMAHDWRLIARKDRGQRLERRRSVMRDSEQPEDRLAFPCHGVEIAHQEGRNALTSSRCRWAGFGTLTSSSRMVSPAQKLATLTAN